MIVVVVVVGVVVVVDDVVLVVVVVVGRRLGLKLDCTDGAAAVDKAKPMADIHRINLSTRDVFVFN